MTIIEAIRAYFMEFPDLPDGAVLIDYLGSEPGQFSVELLPGDPVYKEYADGEKVRQVHFVFASRAYFGADVALCAENQALFENLAEWVEAQNDAEVLPDLGETRQALALEVVSSGFAFSEDAEAARYQMEMRLIFNA